MSESPEHASEEELFVDVSGLITEDDEPVDSVQHAINVHLLTGALLTAFRPVDGAGQPVPFFAADNVGAFEVVANPAIVPDAFLSVGVKPLPRGAGGTRSPKRGDSYFIWEFGKPPDVCIELVSKTQRDELGEKKSRYEAMRVPYYVVYDQDFYLSKRALHAFRLEGAGYVEMAHPRFPELKLQLVEWDGEFGGREARWLRWADLEGNLLPCSHEVFRHVDAAKARAEEAARRAEEEARRAEEEARRADDAEAELARLRERMKGLGVDPHGE